MTAAAAEESRPGEGNLAHAENNLFALLPLPLLLKGS